MKTSQEKSGFAALFCASKERRYGRGPEGAVDRNRANGMMEGSESTVRGKVNQDIYKQNA